MRHPDWTDRLHATVAEWKGAPFAWGQHDCCLFAARCVDAMCGTDYAARLALEYHDEPSARAYLARMGGLELALTHWLDQPAPRVALIRRGDVVLFRDALGQEAIGICTGSQIETTERSGQTVSMSKAITGWRVD